MVSTRVAESQAGVRPVTGRPDSPGLPGRPARSDKLMLLNNLLKIHTSSAPSERVFSRAKLIQQRQRWNLLPQRLEACVMLKHIITSIKIASALFASLHVICISDSVSVSVGVIKSLRIRFVGGEVLYLLICSVRLFLYHPLRRYS